MVWLHLKTSFGPFSIGHPCILTAHCKWVLLEVMRTSVMKSARTPQGNALNFGSQHPRVSLAHTESSLNQLMPPIAPHFLEVQPEGSAKLTWLMIRPMHDALLEDALDNAERWTGHEPHQPAKWSAYVQFLRLMHQLMFQIRGDNKTLENT
jgi:hypothetical protein